MYENIFWSKAKASIYCHILCKWEMQMVIKNSRVSLSSLLCHIVPMALSCLIKEEKPSYYQWYQRAFLKHNIILYLSQLWHSFPFIIKTTGSLVQRKNINCSECQFCVKHKGASALQQIHKHKQSLCQWGQSTSTRLFLYLKSAPLSEALWDGVSSDWCSSLWCAQTNTCS